MTTQAEPCYLPLPTFIPSLFRCGTPSPFTTFSHLLNLESSILSNLSLLSLPLPFPIDVPLQFFPPPLCFFLLPLSSFPFPHNIFFSPPLNLNPPCPFHFSSLLSRSISLLTPPLFLSLTFFRTFMLSDPPFLLASLSVIPPLPYIPVFCYLLLKSTPNNFLLIFPSPLSSFTPISSSRIPLLSRLAC